MVKVMNTITNQQDVEEASIIKISEDEDTPQQAPQERSLELIIFEKSQDDAVIDSGSLKTKN